MFLHFIDLFPPENVHFMKTEKMGEGALELNWTSGKNMDRYLQRTCRSCSGGRQRCDYGLCFLWSWERMAAQIKTRQFQTPVAPGSAVIPEPQITPQLTPRFLLRVAYPSQLSQPCPCPEWGETAWPARQIWSCRKSTGWKGLQGLPSKGYLSHCKPKEILLSFCWQLLLSYEYRCFCWEVAGSPLYVTIKAKSLAKDQI